MPNQIDPQKKNKISKGSLDNPNKKISQLFKATAKH